MRLNADEIRYLVVAKSHRRKGIAQELISYAKWRWSTLWAKTKEGNAATIALLQKEGFVQDHVLYTGPGWLAYSWKRKSGGERHQAWPQADV